MADDVDIHTRQRVVTRLLTAEGSGPLEIHTRLRSVYCEDAIDDSSVTRRVLRFKSGQEGSGNKPRSDRPATVAARRRKTRLML